MLFLREHQPTVTRMPGTQEHDILFDAGRVEGYRICLDTIENLVALQEEREDRPIENP